MAIEHLKTTASTKLSNKVVRGLDWENRIDICPPSLREPAEAKQQAT